MAFYECVFIARQDISSAQVEGLVEDFTKIVDAEGGKVTKNEYWGLRTMAYRIKKNRKGHYVLLNIDGPSQAVSEMERNMRISDDVLRYLTLNVKELEEGPSIMMQQRNGREDRGRGDRRGHHGRPRGDGPPRGKPEEKKEAEAAPAPEKAASKGASQ